MKTKAIPRIRVTAAQREAIETAADRAKLSITNFARQSVVDTAALFGDEALMAAINAERGRASVGEFIHDILKAILLDDIDRPWLKDTRVIAVGEVKEAGSRVEYVQEGGR